ncbi:preprotein translocase subunit SecG [Polaribacter sp.]|nr:preprotein translocase subunit SecG [Polaribacter sp.]
MSYIAFVVLIVVVAVALVLIVMVQNPKGGGLSSTFGGSANTLGGVQNTNNFLDRTTWTLAIAMFALILLSNLTIDRNGGGDYQLNETLDDVEISTETIDEPLLQNNDSI